MSTKATPTPATAPMYVSDGATATHAVTSAGTPSRVKFPSGSVVATASEPMTVTIVPPTGLPSSNSEPCTVPLRFTVGPVDVSSAESLPASSAEPPPAVVPDAEPSGSSKHPTDDALNATTSSHRTASRYQTRAGRQSRRRALDPA